MDATETRFAHLLQPIRDLTKNWEVDVASQLGEYLDELDQICISFDGGETTMNFAEAALLIQGSACIYSKKVEYLYSLVYQALDMISNRKRDKQAPSIGQDGKDKDVVLGGKNDKVEFLLLDDIGEKNPPNIEMRNDSDDLQGLEVVRLTPEPLIPVEDGEKKKLPLYSHKGEVLASCRDFWMNNVTPHANGTIRLDLAATPSQFLRDMPARLQNSEGGPAAGDVSDREAPLLPLNLSEIPEDAGSEGEAFLPLEDNGMELDQQTHTHVERHQAPSERRMLRERPAVEPEQVKQKEISDPWKCHNPFSSSEDKPLKIGKHFTIPQGLQEVSGNKRKRKGYSKLQDFMTWFNGTLSDTLNRKPKKGPSFADMEDLYWSHMKERLKSLKSIHRKAGMLFSREDPEPVEVEPGEADGEVEVFREHPAGGDYDLGQEGDDLSDHENYGTEAPAAALDEQELAMTASKIERFTYEDLVKKNVDLFLVNSQKYAQETELSRRVKDWEEKIDPHLDAQEERQAFDIHDYGNRMVEALGNVGGRRSFASIVRGMGNHEVCRYMLASLQLANDHTVEIHQQEGLEEAMDTMELTLLSKQRAHERFKIHIAPSLTQSQ